MKVEDDNPSLLPLIKKLGLAKRNEQSIDILALHRKLLIRNANRLRGLEGRDIFGMPEAEAKQLHKLIERLSKELEEEYEVYRFYEKLFYECLYKLEDTCEAYEKQNTELRYEVMRLQSENKWLHASLVDETEQHYRIVKILSGVKDDTV